LFIFYSIYKIFRRDWAIAILVNYNVERIIKQRQPILQAVKLQLFFIISLKAEKPSCGVLADMKFALRAIAVRADVSQQIKIASFCFLPSFI